MRLFTLLSEPSQTESSEEIQSAYGKFVEHIEIVSNSDDNTNIHRTLNITRIELVALESVFRYEQEKKCPEKNLSIQSPVPY
jgi:hypothetical protein